MKNLFYILSILFIIGCSSDNDPDLITPETILTITATDDVVTDGDHFFYSIRGIDGSDLNFGEILNSGMIELTDEFYKDSLLSVTLFYYYDASQTIEVISYLDLPIGKDLLLNKYASRIPPKIADIRFENKVNVNIDEIRLAIMGVYAGATGFFPDNGFVFNLRFFDEAPLMLVTTNQTTGVPMYQTFQLDDVNETVIDMNNNVPMENSHTAISELVSLGNFQYSVSMLGIMDNGPDLRDDYSLYRENIMLQGNSMNFSSTSFFSHYRTIFRATSGNISYIQETRPNIPGTFEYIDPEIIVSDDFTDYDASVTGTFPVSYIHSKWRSDTSNNLLWSIYSPESSVFGAYGVHEIPDELIQELPDLAGSDDMRLLNVTAANDENKDWSTALDQVFGNRFNTTSEKLVSKEVKF